MEVLKVEPVKFSAVIAVAVKADTVKAAPATTLTVVAPVEPILAMDEVLPVALIVNVSTPVPATPAAALVPIFRFVPKNPSTVTSADVVPVVATVVIVKNAFVAASATFETLNPAPDDNPDAPTSPSVDDKAIAV
jgi:hypothetical protein